MWGLKRKKTVDRVKRKGHIHPNSVEAWRKKQSTVNSSQRDVMRTILAMGRPAHFREIAQRLEVAEGSVSPRVRELRDKQYLQVAFKDLGFSQKTVNYYELTSRGMKFVGK